MSLALRQLAVKWSVAQLASIPRWLSSGCAVVSRKKMSEEEINWRRYKNLSDKIDAEMGVLPCYDEYDDSLLKLERFESSDFGELKSLLKDLRKFNRKNGVVPPPPRKHKMPHRYIGGGVTELFKLNIDDDEVIETAQVAFEKYKKHKLGSSLEFVSVLQVDIARSFGEYDILIQARDLSVAGVSIKLLARCFVSRLLVDHVGLYRPVSFMDVLRKDKSKKTQMNTDSVMDLQRKDESKKTGDVEALLYANLRNCPIIDKRMGLERKESHRDKSRRSVINLFLDDDILMRVATFAVNQRPDLHFLRVTGAWREKIEDGRYLYHVIFEAFGDGLTRRFYSAISVNAKGGAAKLVDLVAVDCPRATIKWGLF